MNELLEKCLKKKLNLSYVRVGLYKFEGGQCIVKYYEEPGRCARKEITVSEWEAIEAMNT